MAEQQLGAGGVDGPALLRRDPQGWADWARASDIAKGFSAEDAELRVQQVLLASGHGSRALVASAAEAFRAASGRPTPKAKTSPGRIASLLASFRPGAKAAAAEAAAVPPPSEDELQAEAMDAFLAEVLGE